ncbi:MAG: hypothetical protein LBU65_13030, partial [Planctomycetaceae bacterium]|nr:hypothetical protein [Planctomycetaceae bacterium]
EKLVEFNLKYNLAIDSLGVDDFLVSVLDNKDIGTSVPWEHLKKMSITHYSPIKSIPERGIIYLYKEESFSKKVKIWNLFIWDKLVEYFEKSPDADIKLRFRFVTKVDDTFFRAYAECLLSGKDMRSLMALKKSYDKKTDKDDVIKTYDKRYRVTELIEKEDGEIEVKGEFF